MVGWITLALAADPTAKTNADLIEETRMLLDKFFGEQEVGWSDFVSCWEESDHCRLAYQATHGWSPSKWTYRRELMRRVIEVGDNEVRDLERGCSEMVLSGALECAVLFERTGDRKYATLLCERGDVGSCLLDTLDALGVPATRETALADLGEQCTNGSASACAWRLEHLRQNPDPELLTDAFFMGQRACLELHEPVACAASAKVAASLGWAASSSSWERVACAWGYEPSCNPDTKRSLAEEAPPALLGPTQLDQTSNVRAPEPLPGRPRLPGEPSWVLGSPL